MFRKKKFFFRSFVQKRKKSQTTCDEISMSLNEFEWHVEMISWQKSAKKLILNFLSGDNEANTRLCER